MKFKCLLVIALCPLFSGCAGSRTSKTADIEELLRGLHQAIANNDVQRVRTYYSDPADGIITGEKRDHELASMSWKHHAHLLNTTFTRTVVTLSEEHPNKAGALIVYSDGKETYSLSVLLVRTRNRWFVVDVDSKGRKQHQRL